jgi:hypothetical protein
LIFYGSKQGFRKVKKAKKCSRKNTYSSPAYSFKELKYSTNNQNKSIKSNNTQNNSKKINKKEVILGGVASI